MNFPIIFTVTIAFCAFFVTAQLGVPSSVGSSKLPLDTTLTTKPTGDSRLSTASSAGSTISEKLSTAAASLESTKVTGVAGSTTKKSPGSSSSEEGKDCKEKCNKPQWSDDQKKFCQDKCDRKNSREKGRSGRK